jgi:hypothetical protein
MKAEMQRKNAKDKYEASVGLMTLASQYIYLFCIVFLFLFKAFLCICSVQTEQQQHDAESEALEEGEREPCTEGEEIVEAASLLMVPVLLLLLVLCARQITHSCTCRRCMGSTLR